MCGRTACTLAPDDLCQSCTYTRRHRGRDGNRDVRGNQGRKDRGHQGKHKGQGANDKNTEVKDNDIDVKEVERPVWREHPGGRSYFPSSNIAPGSYTPVLLSSCHYPGEVSEVCERVIQPMRWGLIPSWHKGDPMKVSYETNNCRAEGMLQKPTYKVPLQRGRRCVVLADGFYEWKRDQGQKQPYFIYFPQNTYSQTQEKESELYKENDREDMNVELASRDFKQEVKDEPPVTSVKPEMKEELFSTDIKQGVKKEPLTSGCSGGYKFRSRLETTCDSGADCKVEKEDKPWNAEVKKEDKDGQENRRLLTMAGVFDVWTSPDGDETVYSYSVITVESSPAMSWIHHRMPAILTTDEEIDDWLDFSRIPVTEAVKLIHPITEVQMHPVSSMVNNSRCKDPACVQPIDLKDIKSGSNKSGSPVSKGSSQMMMRWLSTSKGPASTTGSSLASPEKQKKPPTELQKSQNLMMGWLSGGKRKSTEKDKETEDSRLKRKKE